MKRKRSTEKKVRCIVYISTVGDMQHVNQREQRQMRYISEYANGNNIEVVKVMRRNVLGQLDVNKHYDRMVQMVSEGFADGILIANMQFIVRRHIVGGTNRTLISVILPPRLHSPVGDRRLLAGQPHAVVALFQRQDSCF